eukprot:TRINITY_DN66454_c0_g1_i1.p1 TRINITY_DN66454_c0_g1~~TRINITY_DN66454_c0_g1_i1.p1  ORF type:complete len:190 (+),score=32.79 TRINITY_DN66454_c0_g1_i1:72-572(+)
MAWAFTATRGHAVAVGGACCLFGGGVGFYAGNRRGRQGCQVDTWFDGKKGRPMLDVTFRNGERSWTGEVLCDTGAGQTALTPAIVEKLAAPRVGRTKVRNALGVEQRDVVECTVETTDGREHPIRPNVRTGSKSPLLGRDALQKIGVRITCRPSRVAAPPLTVPPG